VTQAKIPANGSGHADRFGEPLFESLWVAAWGDQYPTEAAPFSSCTKQLLQQLTQRLRSQPGSVLVDLGCGTGGVGLCLARDLHLTLLGIDSCADAIAIATQRASEWRLAQSAAFAVGDFCATGLEAHCADSVVSIDALPAARDVEAALAETQRILRPNGHLIFTTREPSPHNERHARLGSGWREGLTLAGFEAVEVVERPEVSMLWRSVYTQWIQHEGALRRRLAQRTVDELIDEARRGMPLLDDGRPWLLAAAVARA
jgi:ubiquinone/menaquinone biosynthesis C-methylase UbiE